MHLQNDALYAIKTTRMLKTCIGQKVAIGLLKNFQNLGTYIIHIWRFN